MSAALIVLLFILSQCCLARCIWLEWKRRDHRNQVSKLEDQLGYLNQRYDELVQSLRDKQPEPGRGPTPKAPRKARTFTEFRDADERGVMPRGVKEKPNANL